MVLLMPCPDRKSVFVTSSLRNEKAEDEITAWASTNGYRLAAIDLVFTLYTADHLAREWRFLERITV
jgi:hypothetical protein